MTINIKLNTNHNSSHKYGGVCAHVDAERTTSGYKLRIGGFCPFSLTGCPLICRWFQEKNEYLSSELDALCKYLKSNKSHLYDTSICINLNMTGENNSLDKYIGMVDSYLQKRTISS